MNHIGKFHFEPDRSFWFSTRSVIFILNQAGYFDFIPDRPFFLWTKSANFILNRIGHFHFEADRPFSLWIRSVIFILTISANFILNQIGHFHFGPFRQFFINDVLLQTAVWNFENWGSYWINNWHLKSQNDASLWSSESSDDLHFLAINFKFYDFYMLTSDFHVVDLSTHTEYVSFKYFYHWGILHWDTRVNLDLQWLHFTL